MVSKTTTQDTIWVRFPSNLIEDGQIGKALGSELSNFIGSNPIPRIKKAKAVPILYNLGFLFYTARFFLHLIKNA